MVLETIQRYPPRTREVEGSNPSTNAPPAWTGRVGGEKGGPGPAAKAKAFKRPNWPNLKSDFFFFVF